MKLAVDEKALELRETAWLIERDDWDRFGPKRPHWYWEDSVGIHDWTWDANVALRFPSKEAAEAFPAYRLIASDPHISLTEHVFIAHPSPVAAEREAVPKKSVTLNLSDAEIAALEDLCKRQELSRERIYRAALRLYQLHVLGEPDLGPMLPPESEK